MVKVKAETKCLFYKHLTHLQQGLWKIANVVMPMAPRPDLDRSLLCIMRNALVGYSYILGVGRRFEPSVGSKVL